VLDLIVCEVCGEVFLGGFRTPGKVGNTKFEILTADQPDLENMPDHVSLDQKYNKYAIFWPLNENPPWTTEPQAREYQAMRITRRWVRSKLNVFTGMLQHNATQLGSEEVAGWTYVVSGNHPDEPAMPHRCPRCGADYHRRKRFPTPLRNHRTGFQKACQVIASALCREMPERQNNRLARKLVIFSDSRQDAAKLAAGMERDHFRDMIRLALISAIEQYWHQFGSFVRRIVSQVSLQSINPELYAVALQSPQPEDEHLRVQFQSSNPMLATEMTNWLINLPPTNQDVLDELLSMIEEYSGRIPLARLRGVVHNLMLRLGTNPGGTEHRLLQYRVGSNDYHDWYECYNWQQNPP